MSMDYGSTFGYGIEVPYLTKEQYKNLYQKSKAMAIDKLEDFIFDDVEIDDYEGKALDGECGLIMDILNNSILFTMFDVVKDDETDELYILYVPAIFPKVHYTQEQIDDLFKKMADILDVELKPDYHEAHWFC